MEVLFTMCSFGDFKDAPPTWILKTQEVANST
jgi:hypothetical protein